MKLEGLLSPKTSIPPLDELGTVANLSRKFVKPDSLFSRFNSSGCDLIDIIFNSRLQPRCRFNCSSERGVVCSEKLCSVSFRKMSLDTYL